MSAINNNWKLTLELFRQTKLTNFCITANRCCRIVYNVYMTNKSKALLPDVQTIEMTHSNGRTTIKFYASKSKLCVGECISVWANLNWWHRLCFDVRKKKVAQFLALFTLVSMTLTHVKLHGWRFSFMANDCISVEHKLYWFCQQVPHWWRNWHNQFDHQECNVLESTNCAILTT